jgi:hypothetical protein
MLFWTVFFRAVFGRAADSTGIDNRFTSNADRNPSVDLGGDRLGLAGFHRHLLHDGPLRGAAGGLSRFYISVERGRRTVIQLLRRRRCVLGRLWAIESTLAGRGDMSGMTLSIFSRMCCA